MKVEFDPAKREWTLLARGLDMADAGEVFDGPYLSARDDREDYGEARYSTVGYLEGRMVFVIWTQRGDALRVISMRKANGREERQYGERLRGGSGAV